MRARHLLPAAALAAAGLALGAGSHTVEIDGTSYAPATLTVKRGDTVTWHNADPFPHTVTVPGVFDSGSIAAGKRWRFTPKQAGRYDYICTLHPNMKGTLVVQ